MLEIPIMIGKKQLYIRSDSLNYILSEPKTYTCSKTGEQISNFKDLWFYGTLKGLFDGIFEKKLKYSDAKTMAEFHEDLIKTKNYLMGYVEDHKEALSEKLERNYE